MLLTEPARRGSIRPGDGGAAMPERPARRAAGARARPGAGRALDRPDARRPRRRRDQGRGSRPATRPAAGARRSPPTASAAYFHACNRGKRSIALDFADDGDLAAARRARRGGGRGGRELQGRRPRPLRARLCRASPPGTRAWSTPRSPGFGQDGPLGGAAGLRLHHPGDGRDHGPDRRARRPAREARGRPRRPVHRLAGLYGTIAVLAALRQRGPGGGSGSTSGCSTPSSRCWRTRRTAT